MLHMICDLSYSFHTAALPNYLKTVIFRCGRFSQLQNWPVGQTVGVYNIFSVHFASVTNMFPHYNLSPAVNIYGRNRHMRSSAEPAKNYRFVIGLVV